MSVYITISYTYAKQQMTANIVTLKRTYESHINYVESHKLIY